VVSLLAVNLYRRLVFLFFGGGLVPEAFNIIKIVQQEFLDNLLNRLFSLLIQLLQIALLEDDLGLEACADNHTSFDLVSFLLALLVL
jgi:hypothetical protein